MFFVLNCKINKRNKGAVSECSCATIDIILLFPGIYKTNFGSIIYTFIVFYLSIV